MTDINIEFVSKLEPIFTKPKRIKIIVGGRGSTKSTGVADYVATKLFTGELWCCARENQNSIEESVHRTILDEISRIGLTGFEDTKTSIKHESGGRCFYRGLARNITSLKSTLSGIDGLWIEEGEDISANTLRVLTASVRLNARDTSKLIGDNQVKNMYDLEELLANSDVKMPEIIITMNRNKRTDAIAQKWLSRAEKELKRCGYYEDDTIMVVEMNYTDMPKSWFIASGLEQERLDDKDNLSDAMYNHKWLGDYLDEADNALIEGRWFDAAIDAHKNERLKNVFKAYGAKIAAHDPSDSRDARGLAIRHGSIFTKVAELKIGDVEDGFNWAIDEALSAGADYFLYDADGIGLGGKGQVNQRTQGKHIKTHQFKGSLSGTGMDDANSVYSVDETTGNKLTYKDVFRNNRSRFYIELAERFKNTYNCVVKGEYVDPVYMISIDSDGVQDMNLLRAEICAIQEDVKRVNGLRKIVSKQDMKEASPNMADCMMMSMWNPTVKKEKPKANPIPIANRW